MLAVVVGFATLEGGFLYHTPLLAVFGWMIAGAVLEQSYPDASKSVNRLLRVLGTASWLLLMAWGALDLGPAPRPVVSTFAGHCEAVLNDSDFAQSLNPEGVRDDFVTWYDSVVVAATAYDYLGDASPDGVVMLELQRLQMVGVWREERELHYANSLLMQPGDGIPETFTFDGLAAAFEAYTEVQSPLVESDLQRCLFSALNTYFEGITTHGPDGLEVRIPLAYFADDYDGIVN